jgi:NADPH:quinone reductase-like Zn-dependent oxidoreductase
VPVGRAGGRRMGLLLGWKPFHPPDVERLKTLLANGVIRPHIDGRYPLEQAVEAISLVDEGRATGKVVLVMDSGGLASEGPPTA